MDIQKAADECLFLIDKDVPSIQAEEANTLSHARWMLEGITKGYVQHEKGHRWLGYAQALLVFCKVTTLDQLKEINKTA